MPNSDWTDKLNTFRALVLYDAQEKRDKITDETQKEYSERMDKRETELLGGAYESIQSMLRSAKKSANERVLHSELDAKRQLILKREEIIEDVLASAKERLVEFTKSNEYEKWLLDRTRLAFSELGEGSKTAYLTSEDMRFKDKIEALEKDVIVETAKERGFIGGIKAENPQRRVAVDYSIGELLEEQKTKFLRESNLILD